MSEDLEKILKLWWNFLRFLIVVGELLGFCSFFGRGMMYLECFFLDLVVRLWVLMLRLEVFLVKRGRMLMWGFFKSLLEGFWVKYLWRGVLYLWYGLKSCVIGVCGCWVRCLGRFVRGIGRVGIVVVVMLKDMWFVFEWIVLDVKLIELDENNFWFF